MVMAEGRWRVSGQNADCGCGCGCGRGGQRDVQSLHLLNVGPEGNTSYGMLRSRPLTRG
jgi:hypothetical protein